MALSMEEQLVLLVKLEFVRRENSSSRPGCVTKNIRLARAGGTDRTGLDKGIGVIDPLRSRLRSRIDKEMIPFHRVCCSGSKTSKQIKHRLFWQLAHSISSHRHSTVRRRRRETGSCCRHLLTCRNSRKAWD